MRARTEDLLTIRDGEPIDAEVRARLVADAENLREVQRLAQVAEDLRRLPLIEPPRGAWVRIAAAADTGKRRAYRRPAYRAGAAAAALMAIATLLLVGPWREESNRPETAAVNGSDKTPYVPLELRPVVEREPAVDGDADAGADIAAADIRAADVQADTDARAAAAAEAVIGGGAGTDSDYGRLIAESVRLEMLLAELAPPPRLMNAGTARTIADLEDHIVLVDAELMYAEARDADPLYRQALWSERVDVMNALLHVRYAQAQAPRF